MHIHAGEVKGVLAEPASGNHLLRAIWRILRASTRCKYAGERSCADCLSYAPGDVHQRLGAAAVADSSARLLVGIACAGGAGRARLRCSALTALTASLTATAAAGSLDALSSKDAAGGMRAAISQGIDKAIAQLGAPNGFLNNPKYTIPLPSGLEKADRALRMIGLSGDADQLKAAMNHAAEMAVADAKPVFKQAAQRMTVADAKGILTGGETSATEYFRKATSRATHRPIQTHRDPANRETQTARPV